MTSKDYYRILDIAPDADKDQIREAFRRMALKFHPDRNQNDPVSAERMKVVNEAYAVLSNPGKRSEYDRLRRRFGSSAHQQFKKAYSDEEIFSESDVRQIFEEMAKAFGLRGFDDVLRQFQSRSGFSSFGKGSDFNGKTDRQPPSMTGFFPIAKVLARFTRFLVKMVSGLEMLEDGADIYEEIFLSSDQALKGGTFAYFNRPRRKRLAIKIPPRVRSGQRIRLAGMGGLGKGGGRDGDLFLTVKLQKTYVTKISNFIQYLFSK